MDFINNLRLILLNNKIPEGYFRIQTGPWYLTTPVSLPVSAETAKQVKILTWCPRRLANGTYAGVMAPWG